MDGISVIICCYNSSARIEKTLECLANQKINSAFAFEIILVDNNSSDNTSAVAQDAWIKFQSHIPLIIVKESEPGLAIARETGYKTSKYNFVIYCDDDNRLFSDYLQISYEIMTANPLVGALGGQGIPDYEIKPPQYIEKYAHQYATGPQNDTSGDITISKGYVYGAGIVIRKSCYNMIMEKDFKFILSDRKGNILTSGGDFEMCAALVLSGYKIWYESKLKFYHYLPKGRLTWDYLIRMNQGFGYSLAFLLPYIYMMNAKGGSSSKYTYRYFLLKFILKEFKLSLNVSKLLKKSDERLEWERTKYVIIALLKNTSIIKHKIKELSKFTAKK